MEDKTITEIEKEIDDLVQQQFRAADMMATGKMMELQSRIDRLNEELAEKRRGVPA